MRWTAHIEGGPRRVNHAAVCIGDKILSFGGYCSTEEYQDWDPIPVYVLNTDTLRWSTVDYKKSEVVPVQGYGHTTVAYKDKVFKWGGRNNAVPCETLTMFDPEKLEWTTPKVWGSVPYAKDGHSACVVKNKMYVFGGFEYVTDRYSQDVHCLNLDTFEWKFIKTKGTPPSHRDFHTAVALDDRMYIYGGRGDLNSPYNSREEIYCSQVFYLDTRTNIWVTLNPTGVWPEGRRSHSAWVYNGSMCIFGGYNGNSKTHFNDLYKYSISDNSWELIRANGQPPCKRRRQVCLFYKDKMFMFGGTSPNPQQKYRSIRQRNRDEMLLDNNDLHVLDYEPTLKTLSMLTVLEHELDQSSLPCHIVTDIQNMTTPNRISRLVNPAG